MLLQRKQTNKGRITEYPRKKNTNSIIRYLLYILYLRIINFISLNPMIECAPVLDVEQFESTKMESLSQTRAVCSSSAAQC